MQIQKYLFRMAEKANKSCITQIFCKLIYIITFLLGICTLGLFLYGQFHIKFNEHHLTQCFTSNNFIMKADQFVLIYTDGADSLMQTVKQIKPISNYNDCPIYKNLNYTNVIQQSQLMITGLYGIYMMEKKQREEIGFDNYTIILKNRTPLKDLVYGLPTLITNELIKLVDNKKLSTITESNEIYIKSLTVRAYYSTFSHHADNLPTKIYGIMMAIFVYAIASIITSLYIYATIIFTPAVFLIILRLTPLARTQGYLQAFKAFPWVGMYSMILRASNKKEVREQYLGICWSLILYFLISYIGYYTVTLELTILFFDQPIERSVGSILFGYVAVIQILALLFMRTRPFLNFFPVINSLLIFFYMLYCKFSHFGFKFLAGICLISFGLCLFCWMMINLEIPAQRVWNPENQFVPNIKQPRAGLILAFNLNWINGLPDEWTLLMPLMGHQNFSKKEMSLINQQYEELSQYLIQH